MLINERKGTKNDFRLLRKFLRQVKVALAKRVIALSFYKIALAAIAIIEL